MLALIAPAQAQQVIQIPACGGTLPSSINPSAATITVNPSGEVCVLTGAISVAVPTPTVAIPSPQSVTIYPGNDVTEGSPSDAVAPNPTANSSVISLLKGIMTNVLSPINVTGSFSTSVSSPLGVNIASSPVNVTGNLSVTPASPQNVNLDQINGQLIASPSTYGVAPVGSVQGVNSFITNNVNVTNTPAVSPQNVTVGTPTVVLSGSPVSVGIAGPTPLNVTLNASPLNTSLVAIPGSPIGVILTQSTVTLSGSPVSVGLVQTPINVTIGGTPLSVGIAGPTPLNVTLVAIPGSPQAMTLSAGQVYLSLQPASNVIAYSVTSQFALPSSPGTLIVAGQHQLARVYCALRSPLTSLPTAAYLRIYDTTSTQVATGSQRIFLPIGPLGTVVQTSNSVSYITVPPGEQFTNGIVAIMASTQNGTIFGTGTSLNTETTDCTFAYN